MVTVITHTLTEAVWWKTTMPREASGEWPHLLSLPSLTVTMGKYVFSGRYLLIRGGWKEVIRRSRAGVIGHFCRFSNFKHNVFFHREKIGVFVYTPRVNCQG